MIEPNKPKFKAMGQLPETLMALLIKMWEKELGEIPDTRNLIITYFDSIYVNGTIPEDWYVHEMVHFIRQGNGKDESLARQFCIQYCENKEFRYKEELMAYREQLKFLAGKLNKPQTFEHAKYLAKELSSPKYGNLVSFSKALSDIIKK